MVVSTPYFFFFFVFPFDTQFAGESHTFAPRFSRLLEGSGQTRTQGAPLWREQGDGGQENVLNRRDAPAVPKSIAGQLNWATEAGPDLPPARPRSPRGPDLASPADAVASNFISTGEPPGIHSSRSEPVCCHVDGEERWGRWQGVGRVGQSREG